MKEFILNNWQYFVGLLLLIGGFKVPLLQKMILVGMRSFMSEKVLGYVVLKFLEVLVKSTKTRLDDTWFEQFKQDFENKTKKQQ